LEPSNERIDIGEDTLTRRRRVALSKPTSTPFRVLLIDDDPAIVRLLSRVIRGAGFEVVDCATGAEGLAVIEGNEWELCLLDRALPDMDGIEICRHIKEDVRFDARQVIMLSGYDSLEARVEALNLGADDYITKPFHPTEVLARINAARRVVEMQQQLVEMAKRLEELSGRDDLTGVFNRRHFSSTLDRSFAHSSRHARQLSVAMIDIDNFKNINDSFGHHAGDTVLAEVARRFAKVVRASDYVARYGGEEFVVLLPETQLGDALQFSERLREVIASAPVTIEGRELPVTVSVGAASLAHSGFGSPREMIVAADQALYRAKRNGRNRVEAERRKSQRPATPKAALPHEDAMRQRIPVASARRADA
jgi:two-component system cell cycle response regulator